MPKVDKKPFVKIAVLDNSIEAQVLSSFLDQHNIPYRLRSYYDTAYDGLFQIQKGWGEISAPLSYQQDILNILDTFRTPEQIDEDKALEEQPKNKEGGTQMSQSKTDASTDIEKVLEIGRPPNVKKLFPNSKALIVSAKFIDRAMLKKGNAIAMAANGRNIFVIRGALQAAQRANSAIIIEIAKSEGGANAFSRAVVSR